MSALPPTPPPPTPPPKTTPAPEIAIVHVGWRSPGQQLDGAGVISGAQLGTPTASTAVPARGSSLAFGT
ncbi:hypothetical protein HDU99_010166, partial [Rhizoclosmatium hyalinum]